MNQKGFFKIAVIVFIVIIAGAAGYFFITNKPKKVKLVDAFSGQPISNADVKIYSDNGIRCITAPCPTEGQEWLGKSDNQGVISIPSKVINVVTGITATGYKSGRDLSRDAEKLSSNSWLIELDPDSKIDNSERRLKLMDSQTQRPLPNTTFWVVNNQNCRPPQCQYFSFTGTTNSIGNAYYPISAIEDMDISLIFVNGYKFVKFPTGWVNYKVALEKETSTSFSPGPTQSAPTWKTYRNNDYGFEFKYPENRTRLSDFNFGINYGHGIVMLQFPETAEFMGDHTAQDTIMFTHYNLPGDGISKKWVEDQYHFGGLVSFNVGVQELGGKIAITVFSPEDKTPRYYLISLKNEYLQIEIMGTKSNLSNQVLSTLKFTDEPISVVCPKPQYVSPGCPKVITKARNIKTGEVKEFPDGCLPECWVAL